MNFDTTVKILLEKFTENLYHYTQIWRAAKILSDNAFKLTFSRDEPIDDGDDETVEIYPRQLHPKYKDYYYLSTSRVKVGSYAFHSDKFSEEPTLDICILDLDGRKLSNNYKILPVSYYSKATPLDESEDRVLSKKPIIPNATKYIKAMHLYVSDVTIGNWRTMSMQYKSKYKESMKYQQIIELQIMCKTKKIPLYIYRYFQQYRRFRTQGTFRSIEELIEFYFR